MLNQRKRMRFTFALGLLSALALLIGNFALIEIQHGDGLTLEWTIMHVSYGVFILFHIVALLTLARVLRKENEREAEDE